MKESDPDVEKRLHHRGHREHRENEGKKEKTNVPLRLGHSKCWSIKTKVLLDSRYRKLD
jgi:hypothetical protein